MRTLIGQASTQAGPASRQKQRSHFANVSLSGSYVMRELCGGVAVAFRFVACARSLIGKMHASLHLPHETQVSSLMYRAPVFGSTVSASTGHTYRHSAVGHWRQGSW